MIGFLIGLVIGGWLGVTVMALMQIASESDKNAANRMSDSSN